MTEVYYRKVGKKYEPVSVYDSTVLDGMPKGTHLVVVDNNCTMRKYSIDPALAPLIAAGMTAVDSLATSIVAAGELRPSSLPVSQETSDAYKRFLETLPDNQRYYVTSGSAREMAEKVIEQLTNRAEEMMKNEAMKNAYEHFLLIAKLTHEENSKSNA